MSNSSFLSEQLSNENDHFRIQNSDISETTRLTRYQKRLNGIKKLECSICMIELQLRVEAAASPRSAQNEERHLADHQLELQQPDIDIRLNLLSPEDRIDNLRIHNTTFQNFEDDNPLGSTNTNFFTLQQTLFKTPCGHRYHRDCLLTWMEQSKRCPLCRKVLPTYQSLDGLEF